MENRESKAAELANHSYSYGAGVLPPLPRMPTGVPHNFVSVDTLYSPPVEDGIAATHVSPLRHVILIPRAPGAHDGHPSGAIQ